MIKLIFIPLIFIALLLVISLLAMLIYDYYYEYIEPRLKNKKHE